MNSTDFNSSIRSVFYFLKEANLIRSHTTLSTLTVTSEFCELSLTHDISYKTLFLCGLRNKDFNYLLTDYSYFQFTYKNKNNYRLAYYPNPLANSINHAQELDEFLTEGIIDFEEYSSLISEVSYEITKPMIRFELDRDAYIRLSHPSAHFHIGMHTENRWPVNRYLTPHIFTLLIIKLYYSNEWANGLTSKTKNDFQNKYDLSIINEKLNCKLLDETMFHNTEKSQLYFT